MNDVQWQVLEVPILGTDESVDPVLVPAGTITDSLNVEYTTKGGTLRKRPGLDKIAIAGPDSGNRLIKFKNQLLVVDNAGLVHIPNQALSIYNTTAGSLPTKTVRRNAMAADINGAVSGDVACAGDYVVQATTTPNSMGITVQITHVPSGEVVIKQNILHQGSAIPLWIRCATSSTHVLVAWSDWTGEIYGVRYDCTTAPSVAGATVPTLLINDEKQDVREFTLAGSANNTPRWFICYVESNELGKVVEIDSALANGWSYTFGNTAVQAVSCIEHGDNVWFNWREVLVGVTDSWRYGCVNKDTGIVVQDYVVWCSVADGIAAADMETFATRSIGMSAISPTAESDKVLLFCSQDTVSFSTNAPIISDQVIDGIPVLRWKTGTDAAALGTLQQKRGLQINSYPWRDPGTNYHYIWTATQARYNPYRRYNSTIPKWADDARTMTACLMRVEENSSAALLETTACGEIVSYTISVDVTGALLARRAASPQYTSIDNNGHWRTVVNIEPVPREGQLGTYVPLTNPVELVVRGDHPGRFSSVEFGNSVYITGGLLMQYDGTAMFENNMVAPPVLRTNNVGAAAAGTWDTDWTNPAITTEAPYYKAIYETISAYGERTKSPTTFICKGDYGTLGANDEIEVQFDPLTVTRRVKSTSIDNIASKVTLALYRTPFPNDTIFQKLNAYTNNQLGWFTSDSLSLAPSSVFDRGSTDINDSDPGRGLLGPTLGALSTVCLSYRIDSSEPLYTDSGEYENVLPYGGCTGIAVHQDRLWICGGEEADLIWYSKPRADNRTAEFALEQQIRLPGRSVVALASMDQLLYVFCEDAVFAIDGQGPNAKGEEGSFSEPFPVTLALGTSQPRSVISTPIGIFFKSQAGMYLIDRGTRQAVWIGQALADTFDTYTDVLAAQVVQDKTQVRFSVYNDELGVGFVVVFDWEEQRWTKWAYTNVTYVADMSDWQDHNTAVLGSSGGLYEENYSKFLDDETPYYAYAETGWLSFGSLQGFKRIRKVGLLMEKLGNHGVDVQLWFNYTKTGLTATKAFSSTEINTIQGPEWVRVTMPYQKQPSVKLRLTETAHVGPLGDIAESAGFAWKSMSFEVGLLPGLKRLPQNQSK